MAPTSTPQPWRDRLANSVAQRFPGTPLERGLVLTLLALALLLRCWGFPHIPYTHDEISALVRVDFPTLAEAIDRGVWNVDTHPPGTHAFLWGWTRLFGYGDGAVKAPFIAMSVLALLLLYRFAHAWAGGPTAVIATALLATLQYTVMYGQIARPYAMGFLTIACTADQLTRYTASGSRRALVGTMAGAVMSAYTHHFALMLAALIGASGLWLVPHERRREYVVAAGIGVLAYLPNLPLFFAQLGWKGLDEWLTAPTRSWIQDHLWWIAHCSVPMALVLLALLAASLVLRLRSSGSAPPLWIITLLWGLTPLVVGYAYSVLRSPVLQYSVLLFSFPFLLIGALSGLRRLPQRLLLPVTLGITVVSVATLVFTRKHYAVFNASKYEAIVNGTRAEAPSRLAIIHTPPEVVAFYRKLWCVTPSKAPHINLHGASPQVLDSVLRNTDATELFYGQTTHGAPENIARIQRYFPFLVARKDLVEGQTFTFQRRPSPDHLNDRVFTDVLTAEAIGGGAWMVDGDVPLVADTQRTGYMAVKRWDLSGRMYGIKFERPVDTLVQGPNDLIEVSADVELGAGNGELTLVAELLAGDSSVFYRSTAAKDLGITKGRTTLITTIKLSDIPGNGRGRMLRTYLNNPGSGAAWISSVQVAVRAGDPVLYAFFRPLLPGWRFR